MFNPNCHVKRSETSAKFNCHAERSEVTANKYYCHVESSETSAAPIQIAHFVRKDNEPAQ
jgi:hypothetical protein